MRNASLYLAQIISDNNSKNDKICLIFKVTIFGANLVTLDVTACAAALQTIFSSCIKLQPNFIPRNYMCILVKSVSFYLEWLHQYGYLKICSFLAHSVGGQAFPVAGPTIWNSLCPTMWSLLHLY